MKIAFVAMRFHTNEYEQIRGLMARDVQVDYYANISAHSENHSVLTPNVVGYNFLSRKLFQGDKRLKYGVMPISAIRQLVRSNPDIVMLKGFTVQTMVLKKLLSLHRIKSVVYVQRYMESAEGRKGLLWRLLFGKEIMTAVKKCGSSAMEERSVGTQHWKFVPFVIRWEMQAENRKYCQDGILRFLTVGKFQGRKKLLEIVQVFAEKYGNNPGYNLTIVGTDYDKRYLQTLKEAVAACSNVRLLKNVDHKDMGKLYAAHDVFIMGSVHEAASCSQLEAMGQGLAVLCCTDNGTASCVISGENGYVYEPEDYENSLGRVMEKIVAEKDRVPEMGQVSLRLIKTKYSIENYVTYIDEVLAHEGR